MRRSIANRREALLSANIVSLLYYSWFVNEGNLLPTVLGKPSTAQKSIMRFIIKVPKIQNSTTRFRLRVPLRQLLSIIGLWVSKRS